MKILKVENEVAHVELNKGEVMPTESWITQLIKTLKHKGHKVRFAVFKRGNST